jgi:opine dehydrogenase
MKVAILGAGNGGKTAAADMTLAGHEVNLYEAPQFQENLKPVWEAGGINLVGVGRNGFAKINIVTTDLAAALDGVEMIVPVVSAFGHRPLARACTPHLTDGQMVVLNPGSTLGSLEFLQEIEAAGSKAKIKIGELHTLTYACRGSGAEVRILLEVRKLWLSAFPASDTAELVKKFNQLYPMVEAGKNIMEVGLNNGNLMAHPSPALLNAGRIEYSNGEFYHYQEGITPNVANVIKAIDDERLQLCRTMGYPEIPTVDRMFMMGYGVTQTTLYESYNKSPVFCGEHPIKGPFSVTDRYFVEDTMYGLVTCSSLGRSIGVSTPTIDAVIQLISMLNQRDYFAEGARSLERFDLNSLTPEQLNAFFETGARPDNQ